MGGGECAQYGTSGTEGTENTKDTEGPMVPKDNYGCCDIMGSEFTVCVCGGGLILSPRY